MSITVTATASGAGSANGIEIAPLVYTGASLTQPGATAASETVTVPELAITPGHSGSVVVGAVGTGGSATAFSSPAGSITSVANSTVVAGGRWGIYRSGSTTTSSTTYGWAAPTGTSGNIYIAQAEILASGTLALDASTPAVASTSSAKTITSASFTPPAGAVIVVAVITSWSGSGAVSVALSDSASAYTWTQLSGTGTTDLCSVWAGIPVPVAHTPSAALTVAPSFSAALVHARFRTASLTVTPSFAAPATGGDTPSTGLLTEAGGFLLTEAGGFLLTEAPGGTSHTVTASLTVAPSLTAAEAHGNVRGASLATAPSLSAAPLHGHLPSAALAVTPSLAASGTRSASRAAALTATSVLAASGVHGNVRTAALAVAPVLSASGTSGAPTFPATAALTVTPALTASASAAHTASASLAVSPSLTAAALHVHAPSAALTVSPAPSAAATRGAGRTASLAVAPSLTAAAATGTGGSLTVAPLLSASAVHGNARTAALTVTPALSAARVHGNARTASLTPGLVRAATAFAAAPVAFPAVPLDLQCDLNLGTWTGVTTYAYQRDGSSAPVTITRGRPDESSQANPATCAWQWNNRDGRFSPRNPASPYFGALGRNTPVRWSVPAQATYLRLENDDADRAAIVENARLDIAGSIEMRIALRLTDWQACIVACKWDGGACWLWYLNDDGTMQFTWTDGTNVWRATTTVPLPYASGDFALRVTMNASTGTVTFYTAAGASVDPGTWAQLGSTVSPTGGASTSITTAGSPLVIGWSANFAGQLCGRVYEYRLYGSSGTVVADPVFTAQAPGATSFGDAPGNTWLVQGGAEISSRDYRFHGEMSAQPPKWDVTGTDMYVDAQAGGPLRRLGQGANNAVSAMKRAILAQTGSFAPVAYWPMEDAAGSSVFGSAITGGSPMTFDLSPAPDLATDSTFAASAPLPGMNGSRLQGPVAPYAATGTWTVRFPLKVSPPGSNAVLLRIVCPSGACPVVYVIADTSGNLELEGFSPGGSSAFNTGFANMGAVAGVWCSVECVPVSGGVQYSLVTLAPGASNGLALNETVAGSLGSGNVTLVQPDVTGAFTGTVIGHMQVQSAWQSLFAFADPLNAWTGETAAARYARLAAENGYQARILGSPAYSALMGPQGEATLSDLLQECETADLGQQFEPRQQLALGYRTLASMCGQDPGLTLDYSQSQPGGVNGDGSDSGLDPTYDDQLTKNDWTVTRGAASGSQGATVQVTLDDGSAMSISPPPDGVGDYANSQTANVESDSQIVDVAGWMVRTGTIDEARWPVIPVNLARAQMAPLLWEALGVETGDYLELLNVPDLVLYDPVKQVALGFKESLGGFHWTLEFNAVPESAYEVIILDDPVFGRADTDGSTLFAGVSASATSLTVVTPNAQLVTWTTSASDFPFDIAVGGERMTVTNVTGTGVSTQTFTVTRSVNGVSKSQSAGADVRLWSSPILALT